MGNRQYVNHVIHYRSQVLTNMNFHTLLVFMNEPVILSCKLESFTYLTEGVDQLSGDI